jgi:hypothetical protein
MTDFSGFIIAAVFVTIGVVGFLIGTRGKKEKPIHLRVTIEREHDKK